MSSTICTTCGHKGATDTMTRGHLLIEIILWLCFIVPGLIYSIWRQSTKYEVCRQCEATTLISIDSPVARKFMADHGIEAPPIEPEFQPPNAATVDLGRSLGRMVGRLFK
jgi:hypothetical protein